jgi:hypothetical protein
MGGIGEERLSEKIRGQMLCPKPAANGLFQVPAGEQFVAANREQGLAACRSQRGLQRRSQKVNAESMTGNQLAALRPLKETILRLLPIFPEVNAQEQINEKEHRIVPFLDMR